MKDIMQIPLPSDASKEVLDYLRAIREIIAKDQADIDVLKKQVARK